MHIRIPISFFLVFSAVATANLQAQSVQDLGASSESVEQQQTEQPQLGNIEFVKRAIERSEAEVELGELALEKSENQTVRAFALQIISEHKTASEKLQEVAGEKEVKPTTELADSHQQIYERLKQLSAEEFDLAYIEVEIKDLKSHLDLYRREARKGNGTELEALAARTLPKLEQQLVNAEDIKLTL